MLHVASLNNLRISKHDVNNYSSCSFTGKVLVYVLFVPVILTEHDAMKACWGSGGIVWANVKYTNWNFTIFTTCFMRQKCNAVENTRYSFWLITMRIRLKWR